MRNVMEARNMLADLGPGGFAQKAFELLGLANSKSGRFTRNRDLNTGRPVLESAKIKPDAFSLRAMGEALLGHDLDNALRIPAHQQVNVLESGTAIQPSQFANVSAFNTTVAGLLEAKMLETYNRPEFIADQLVETIPSNKRSEKFIGISGLGDVAEERKPGNRHARAELSERYATTPETVNRGIGVDVTREAVMFDMTRQLLTQAESASETLALRKEYNVVDLVIGVTNTYTYNGTNYNTYLAAGGWINSHVNPFATWVDVDEALQLFVDMVDPETGEPINITARQILCMPAVHMNMSYHLDASGVERRTATTQENVAVGKNPVAGMFQMVAGPTYPYAYKRARAANGLNLSEANAKGRWWMGDFKKAFAYIENLPLTVVRANASDYEMADRGLVFSLFADEMGITAVKDPRYVVENKQA